MSIDELNIKTTQDKLLYSLLMELKDLKAEVKELRKEIKETKLENKPVEIKAEKKIEPTPKKTTVEKSVKKGGK